MMLIDPSYKQGTVGDCNNNRPGGWDLKGQRKWDAWNALRGTYSQFWSNPRNAKS
jgi:acyl-CoA-binding protein